MNLVIEEINRGHKILHRYRFDDKQKIRIGRALDNDIICHEQHVCPHHAEIVKHEDGSWHIHDLNSVNGIKTNKGKIITGSEAIESGQTFILGRSYLRIWDVNHPVEPTWHMHSAEGFFHLVGKWPTTLSIATITVSVIWLLAELQNFRDKASSNLMFESLSTLVVALAWAALWALGGRIARQDSRFAAHLSITIMAMGIIELLHFFAAIFAYNWHLGLWLGDINLVLTGITANFLLWGNLFLALHQRRERRLVVASSLTWIVIILITLPGKLDKKSFTTNPRYDSLVMPASILWQTPVNPKRFIENSAQLFKEQEKKLSELKKEDKNDEQ